MLITMKPVGSPAVNSKTAINKKLHAMCNSNRNVKFIFQKVVEMEYCADIHMYV